MKKENLKSFNYQELYLISRDREARLSKKIVEQDKLNVITVIISILIILSLFLYLMHIKRQLFKAEIQIKQYKIHYEDTVNSKEMNAINKCKNEDYWKAECIAYELNEGK